MINEQREAGGEKHRALSHATPSLSREPPARNRESRAGTPPPGPGRRWPRRHRSTAHAAREARPLIGRRRPRRISAHLVPELGKRQRDLTLDCEVTGHAMALRRFPDKQERDEEALKSFRTWKKSRARFYTIFNVCIFQRRVTCYVSVACAAR